MFLVPYPFSSGRRQLGHSTNTYLSANCYDFLAKHSGVVSPLSPLLFEIPKRPRLTTIQVWKVQSTLQFNPDNYDN